jgi:hypothetical protein
MPPKLDLRKQLRHLYSPSARDVSTVDVPAMSYLMVDGEGDPNLAQAYRDAVEALYAVAYTLKFAIKKQRGLDYAVMPLEGLWWLPDMGEHYSDVDFAADKSRWHWTAMIVQPDFVSAEDVAAAAADAKRRKRLPAIDGLRLERLEEGPAVQIMHIGPYSAERPAIDRLHVRIAELGNVPAGKHHEIYLSDPGRTAPEKLRTVVRQPMRPG